MNRVVNLADISVYLIPVIGNTIGLPLAVVNRTGFFRKVNLASGAAFAVFLAAAAPASASVLTSSLLFSPEASAGLAEGEASGAAEGAGVPSASGEAEGAGVPSVSAWPLLPVFLRFPVRKFLVQACHPATVCRRFPSFPRRRFHWKARGLRLRKPSSLRKTAEARPEKPQPLLKFLRFHLP